MTEKPKLGANLLYPVESNESWSRKYGIHPKEGVCTKCGLEVIADKPFADKDLRGFISVDHGCGISRCLITFKCFSKEEQGYWIEIAQEVAASCTK